MNELAAVLMQFAATSGAGLAGWAIVSAAIYYLFPLVPALEPPAVRFGAIAALLVVCLAVNGALSWRARLRRRALAAGMEDDPPAGRAQADEAEAAEEVAELRARLKQSLLRLRRRGWRGRQLYDQPWFVLIGPPGSGKTTALMNCGLHLPLRDDEGGAAVSGVGGTRLCDWWFADEAVLIDTAGRYTTQDSSAAVDAAGWRGFLDLLRRTRPRQPINGVIVVLSLPELATATPAELGAHARAVRLRINEITERTRLRVPVYLMLSKADQLRGFDAYFDDLDAGGRSQVWGVTFPLDKGAEAFASEFRLLLRRLEDRLVERLHAERAGQRRALIGQFPLQVASLEQPLAEFLKLAFSGSRVDPAPMLRGVYMTSATQHGTPIDRLTGMLARSFGLDQTSIEALRPVSGKSYFVTRLIREVILGEALLVSRNRGWRTTRALRLASFAAIGLGLAVGGGLIWRADAANRVAVEQASEAFAAYRQRISGLKLDPVTDDDLPGVAPALDAAAALQRAASEPGASLGLSQEAKLAQADQFVYRRALERILLPRLLWRLERQLRASFEDPTRLYDATRVYLMLAGQGPLQPGAVRAWMKADWDVRFPGALNAPLRSSLAANLDALLAAPLPQISPDAALIEAARAVLSRVSLAERIYSRVRADSAAQSLPDWAPAAVLGPNGVRLFRRPSGRPLTDGVPGLFTARGHREALVRALPAVTRDVAVESWVLGRVEQAPTEGPQLAALEQSVVTLYAEEFRKVWDALLGDLVLAPFRGRQQTIRDLYVLSSPQSPMRDLLVAITQELRVREPQDASENGREAGGPPPPALAAIASHYGALFELVGKGDDAAPFGRILQAVSALHQALAASGPAGANAENGLPGGGDPAELLLAEADRQPAPVSSWLRELATSGRAILGDATRASLVAAYAAANGPQATCRSVVDGHFPFDASSTLDAPIDDFARLFGPGGQFDLYFAKQIAPFVDTSGATWRPRTLGGVEPPIDAATAAGFQRIAAIRDAFFPTGGAPQLSFSLAPAAGGEPAATLAIGGTTVSKDVNQAASFNWPGGGGLSAASLSFEDQGGFQFPGLTTRAQAAGPALQFSGPWAALRLIRRGRVAPTRNPTVFNLTFDAAGRRAAFVLQAGSVRNPFARDVLTGFRCPIIR